MCNTTIIATLLKLELIKKIKIDNDKLIIISTHIKEDLERLTDKIYYFDGGTIIDNENK